MRLLVTGGCGFVGSNFVRYVLQHYGPEMVTNVDALSTGRLANLDGVAEEFGDRYEFLHADLADLDRIEAVLAKHQYFAVLHFAAEGAGPAATASLLAGARRHGIRRFVFDSKEGASEELAEAEARALAAFRDHGQEVVMTRATDTYGPFQPPTGFIPSVIVQAVRDPAVQLGGDGSAIRDWLHVEDHCAALFAALLDGQAGAVYRLVSGHALPDIDLAHRILEHLGRERELIDWRGEVPDRQPSGNAEFADPLEPLAWKPRLSLDAGLRTTIDWYVRHREWWESLPNR